MPYLKRLDAPPTPPSDMKLIEKRFDVNAYEINIEGGRVEWEQIDEVEVAQAARINSPAGWFVKKVMYGGERYHVGVFFGRGELVLTNISLEQACYVVATVAYYAKQPIRYTGIEGIVPTIES
jgi:hypothetical protein